MDLWKEKKNLFQDAGRDTFRNSKTFETFFQWHAVCVIHCGLSAMRFEMEIKAKKIIS